MKTIESWKDKINQVDSLLDNEIVSTLIRGIYYGKNW